MAKQLKSKLTFYEGLFGQSQTSREKRLARETCHEILRLHALEKILHPGTSDRGVYQNILMRHLTISDTEASLTLTRAEESFARWPYERDLKLRDVILYLIVLEQTSQSGSEKGVGPHIKKTIQESVPGEL